MAPNRIQPHVNIPHQPLIAPGLSFPDTGMKFLGIFTATHLSICLLIAGFGLIVTGLLGVVTQASLDASAFRAVGISLICFGLLLIAISVAIFVMAIRWGKKRVHVLDRPHVNYPPVSIISVSYPQFPCPANTESDRTQNVGPTQETHYPTQPSFNPHYLQFGQNLVTAPPTAPPNICDSRSI